MTCLALPLKKCLKRERASCRDHLSGSTKAIWGYSRNATQMEGHTQRCLKPQGPIVTKSHNTNKQGGVGGPVWNVTK